MSSAVPETTPGFGQRMVQAFKDTPGFVRECWEELTKVTWPDRDQLRNATLVVIAFTIVISIIIWLMDMTVGFLIRSFMGLFGA